MAGFKMLLREAPVYVWRRESISRFESAWSLSQKFAYLNVASAQDIRKVFGSSSVNDRAAWGSGNGFFLECSYFDDDAFAKILNLSRTDVELSKIGPYRLPIDGAVVSDIEIISSSLRFCPQCISNGFHSPLFQLLFVDRCPIHRAKLEDRCPSCRAVQPYNLSRRSLENPYGCDCGHVFWPERDSQFWNKALSDEDETKIENYVHWIKKVTHAPELKLRQLGFSGNPTYRGRIYESRPKAIRKIARFWSQVLPLTNWDRDVFFGEDFEKRVDSYSGRPFSSIGIEPLEWWMGNSPSYLDTQILTNESIDQLVTHYIPIYKSIKRRFKSIILRHHQRCSKNLDKLTAIIDISRIPPYCSFVYSFKIWQRYWEGAQPTDRLPEGEQIHLKVAIRRTMSCLSDINRIIVLKNTDPRSLRDAYHFIEWVSQRIFAINLLASFHESLRIVSKIPLDNHDTIFSGLPIEISNPYFLVNMGKEMENISFHWWTPKVLDDLQRSSINSSSHQDSVASASNKFIHMHFDFLKSLTEGIHDNIMR